MSAWKLIFLEYFLFHIIRAIFVCAIEASWRLRPDYVGKMKYWFSDIPKYMRVSDIDRIEILKNQKYKFQITQRDIKVYRYGTLSLAALFALYERTVVDSFYSMQIMWITSAVPVLLTTSSSTSFKGLTWAVAASYVGFFYLKFVD